jgi:hypothetical protein
MAANTAVLKELNGLKHCCDPLNISHSAGSKKTRDMYWNEL